ncbi:MAG: hypothetical protein GYA23_09735 [Methanomicrobiales archaeon]|nr:hypothetical protein [Methanomicrobiales archaeon]
MVFFILWILLLVGAFHPLFSSIRGIFPPDPRVELNTTTIDPAVSISFDEYSIYSKGRKTQHSSAAFGIGITNNHSYNVMVNGQCTFVDGSGRLISSEPWSHSVSPGIKSIHSFYMRIWLPGDLPSLPLSENSPTPSSPQKGVLSCAILNVTPSYQPVYSDS